MRVNQIVVPVLEPITLAQLKLHLRLSSGAFSDEIDEVQSLVPDSYVVADNYTTHDGTGIDVLGKTAVVILNSGTNGASGTVDAKIQESDDDSAYTDWTGGAFTQVTEAIDNAIQEIAYTGAKQYIKVVAKVLVAACEFSATVIRLTGDSIEDDLLTASIQGSREHVEDITRRQLLTATWDYYLDEFPSENYIKLPFGNLQSVTRITYKESDWDGTDEPVSSLTISDSACVESNGTYALIFTGDCTEDATGTYTIASNIITAVSLTSGGEGYLAIPTVATQSADGGVTAEIGPGLLMLQDTDYTVETNGEACGRIVLLYGKTWPSFTAYPSNPIICRFVCGWTAAASIPEKIRIAVKRIAAKMYKDRGEDVIGQSVRENRFFMSLLNSSRLWDEFK